MNAFTPHSKNIIDNAIRSAAFYYQYTNAAEKAKYYWRKRIIESYGINANEVILKHIERCHEREAICDPLADKLMLTASERDWYYYIKLTEKQRQEEEKDVLPF